jgi:hypothetical protein
MAIDLADVVSSVALGNTKNFGDAPSLLLNGAFLASQEVRTAGFVQYNKHAARVDVIAEAALTAGVKALQSIGVTEGVAIRQIDPASGQVATKSAQTTPPGTAGA